MIRIFLAFVDFFCPGTFISIAMQPFSVKFCKVVELCLGHVLSSFGGDTLRDIQVLDQGLGRNFWLHRKRKESKNGQAYDASTAGAGLGFGEVAASPRPTN